MDLDKSKIKAVIFDWGGVCCKEGEPFASAVLQERAKKSPDEICQDVMDVYLDFYRGKYTTDEFYSKIIEHYGLKQDNLLNPKQMAQAYIDSTAIWQEVLDIAKRLQGKYKVGLLSDLTPLMKEYIHRERDVGYFFPIEIYSCDDGINMVKIDGTAIFEKMMERLGVVEPRECLFIDNSKSKVAIAEKLGMRTLLFVDKEQFLEDIKQYL